MQDYFQAASQAAESRLSRSISIRDVFLVTCRCTKARRIGSRREVKTNEKKNVTRAHVRFTSVDPRVGFYRNFLGTFFFFPFFFTWNSLAIGVTAHARNARRCSPPLIRRQRRRQHTTIFVAWAWASILLFFSNFHKPAFAIITVV